MNDLTMAASDYKTLNQFLSAHIAVKSKGKQSTHTRIPDKSKSNSGAGSYCIPPEELDTFYKLYYNQIWNMNKPDHLTEKQLTNGTGPLAIDFDFRYDYEVDKRLHTNEHIQDIILLYLEELKECFVFTDKSPFDIYVFEKPNVNRVEDKSITKDGIHMIFGFQVPHTVQLILRNKVMDKMKEVLDLPLTNKMESVLDEGISAGSVNWQLYGSCKPNNESYRLTQHFTIGFDETDKEFTMDENVADNFNLKDNFKCLSVQNNDIPKFEMTSQMKMDFEQNNIQKKRKKVNSNTRVKRLIIEEDLDSNISLNNIKNKQSLIKAVNMMLETLTTSDYEIRETHEYTQVLPAKYYEPGSHVLNRQVAFALKYTDERLFLSWVLLRSKADDFDYDTIPTLYNDWVKYFVNKRESPVTNRSIMYWARMDNYEGYNDVKKQSIDHFIEESILSETEYDFACVLKQMHKDKYICVNLDKKGSWYVYKNHKWNVDKGLSLRGTISKDMYELYSSKLDESVIEYNDSSVNDEKRDAIGKRIKKICKIRDKLKKTNDKNNIMREAMELFYDDKFIRKMDNNKYLMCFKNGVVDFKNKIFRDGFPEDYITKCTNVNYVEYNESVKEVARISKDVTDFMDKLFPIPELNKYMWQHLASCMIGINKNQTFNVYHGSGSNGKSILADLMSLSLGEYKGVVPITLVTEKRGMIGGTSDEVIKLKGVRYAVMQEPSKGVKLNEGIMKELTGGDPIQARGLYCESEVFEPQFSLVVCTNNLFEINSNDDGTWRRIRKCDFMSKFVDKNETHNDDTKYIFPKDKDLKDKLPKMAPIFAGMLVKQAFDSNGVVEDCSVVMEASNKYRKRQDHINAYINEFILKTENKSDRITKRILLENFKKWYSDEHGTAEKKIKGQEVFEIMDKRFGSYTSKGWLNAMFISQDDELDEEEN